MKVDKFGVSSLAIGLLLLAVLLHYGFMPGGVWTIGGLISAALAAVIGGLLILAVMMIAIGFMLLLL